MRCVSWRPAARPHDPLHDPGTCRRCWRPCHARVAEPGRCTDCTTALLHHHDPDVRLLLADDPLTDVESLQLLSSDPAAQVALTAAARLSPTLPAGVFDDDEGW